MEVQLVWRFWIFSLYKQLVKREKKLYWNYELRIFLPTVPARNISERQALWVMQNISVHARIAHFFDNVVREIANKTIEEPFRDIWKWAHLYVKTVIRVMNNPNGEDVNNLWGTVKAAITRDSEDHAWALAVFNDMKETKPCKPFVVFLSKYQSYCRIINPLRWCMLEESEGTLVHAVIHKDGVVCFRNKNVFKDLLKVEGLSEGKIEALKFFSSQYRDGLENFIWDIHNVPDRVIQQLLS